MLDDRVRKVYESFAQYIDNLCPGCLKALYAYGSAVYGDLHAGYSDLDFFAVVSRDISGDDFDALSAYRKQLRLSENKLFGMLEGEFVPERTLQTRTGGGVAYWGTSGERMKDGYDLAGFSMRSLLNDGVLILGTDVRSTLPHPTDKEMLEQVDNLIRTIRKHATVTAEDIHSADWLFLICQSLYWLKTGGIACKTKAAEWTRIRFMSPWCDELDRAIFIRCNPEEADQEENKHWLARLGPSIQKACGTLAEVYDAYTELLSLSINPSIL